MSKINLNLNDFKSSGVYFMEIDNSIINVVDTDSLRLAVGFSKTGPFNVPVYLSDTDTRKKVFGAIDTKLEKKGIFFNRLCDTMLNTTPIFALNLLPVTKTDKIEAMGVSFDTVTPNTIRSKNSDNAIAYIDVHDKSRFWNPSSEYLTNELSDANTLMNIANIGTSDVTIFIRKAENLNGYSITASDWYGTADDIPFNFINPTNYISDYFVQVVVVKGKWELAKLSQDVFWKRYFDNNGLKKDMFTKFLRSNNVEVIGDWTGCMIPDFYSNTGTLESIVPIINQMTTKTGILASFNEAAMDTEYTDFDVIGNKLDASTTCNFLSYNFTIDSSGNIENGKQVINNITIDGISADATIVGGNSYFTITGTADKDGTYNTFQSKVVKPLAVGSLIKLSGNDSSTGKVETSLYRIIKKDFSVNAENKSVITIHISGVLPNNFDIDSDIDSEVAISVHSSLTDMYSNLNPISLGGLDVDAVINKVFADGEESGVKKIYAMLMDKGIKRGLLNPDMIDFRYIIDTMAHGLSEEMGGKKYISKLASTRMKCSALLNLPSITEFTNTNTAAYYDYDDPYQIFSTKYIPTGGNDEMIKTTNFSLPSEENGSKYTAVFAPFLKYVSGGRTILVPPAADVSNTIIRKFQGGDPYVTPANTNGILSNRSIIGVEYQLDQTDRDYLEPFGVNAIISRDGNVMIYGDRTAYQDVISDFNYFHVRELLNTIEIEANAILQGYVFKYNNPQTRSEILTRLTPFLQSIQDNGALYKYEIQMDENNNGNEVIDRSFAIIDIGVWVTKNMEKIVCRITVNKLSE